MSATEPVTSTGYHAHIYFVDSNRDYAAEIRETIGERFDVELGR